MLRESALDLGDCDPLDGERSEASLSWTCEPMRSILAMSQATSLPRSTGVACHMPLTKAAAGQFSIGPIVVSLLRGQNTGAAWNFVCIVDI